MRSMLMVSGSIRTRVKMASTPRTSPRCTSGWPAKLTIPSRWTQA